MDGEDSLSIWPASFCVALKSLLSRHINISIISSEKKENIFMSLSLPHVTLKDKKVHEEGDLAPAQPGARASGTPECHEPASLSVTRDSPRRLQRPHITGDARDGPGKQRSAVQNASAVIKGDKNQQRLKAFSRPYWEGCAHACLCACVYACVYTCAYACVHVCTCTCVLWFIVHACVCVYIRVTCGWCVHTCPCIYVCV